MKRNRKRINNQTTDSSRERPDPDSSQAESAIYRSLQQKPMGQFVIWLLHEAYLHSFPCELGSSGSTLERPCLVELDETFVILKSHSSCDTRASGAPISGPGLGHIQAKPLGVNKGVEGSSIADVHRHITKPLYGHLHIWWDVLELVQELNKGLDEPTGTVNVHLCLWGLVLLHQFVVDSEASQGDDSVSAHGAVALVVHEQHPQVSLGYLTVHNQGTVHVVVSPGLEHQHPPEVVQMFPDVAPLGQHAVTFDLWVAAEDDARGRWQRESPLHGQQPEDLSHLRLEDRHPTAQELNVSLQLQLGLVQRGLKEHLFGGRLHKGVFEGGLAVDAKAVLERVSLHRALFHRASLKGASRISGSVDSQITLCDATVTRVRFVQGACFFFCCCAVAAFGGLRFTTFL
ncbi:hypothetical protein INR49_017651 [Caranx melampygus]|nr:hypothetical protein INR49_017651 [Caranx melampygus]